jgi:hypothetical protein
LIFAGGYIHIHTVVSLKVTTTREFFLSSFPPPHPYMSSSSSFTFDPRGRARAEGTESPT